MKDWRSVIIPFPTLKRRSPQPRRGTEEPNTDTGEDSPTQDSGGRNTETGREDSLQRHPSVVGKNIPTEGQNLENKPERAIEEGSQEPPATDPSLPISQRDVIPSDVSGAILNGLICVCGNQTFEVRLVATNVVHMGGVAAYLTTGEPQCLRCGVGLQTPNDPPRETGGNT